MRVAIIGAGRVGCAIGRALREAKQDVVFVTRHQPPDGCEPWTLMDAMDPDTDLVLIATPDREISGVAALLADRVSGSAVIGHFSGALGSDLLGTGFAGRFSAHPVHAFPLPLEARPLPKGVIFTLEGDKKGLETASEFLDILDARYFSIDATRKPLYHAACVIAANFTSLNAIIASRLFRAMGHPWPDDLVQALLSSVIGLRPFNETTITGPVVRADVDVIKAHIHAMESKFPVFSKYYTTVVSILARILTDAGVIKAEQWKAIKEILKNNND